MVDGHENDLILGHDYDDDGWKMTMVDLQRSCQVSKISGAAPRWLEAPLLSDLKFHQFHP